MVWPILSSADGIKCVLSLLDCVNGFVKRYVRLVEDDSKIKYVHKMVWNSTVCMIACL